MLSRRLLEETPVSGFHRLLLPALSALLLSGCVIAVDHHPDDEDGDGWRERQRENRRSIAELELGRSRSSVEVQLGEPDFFETFQRDGERFVVLRYRTHRVRKDGETTRDETTPLVFVDDALVGWGESAVEFATADR
jgi:hypothetical protein